MCLYTEQNYQYDMIESLPSESRSSPLMIVAILKSAGICSLLDFDSKDQEAVKVSGLIKG